MKNVKKLKLHAQVLILKKNILAQMNVEDQNLVHVVVVLVILVNLAIIMIIVPAHLMIIQKI